VSQKYSKKVDWNQQTIFRNSMTVFENSMTVSENSMTVSENSMTVFENRVLKKYSKKVDRNYYNDWYPKNTQKKLIGITIVIGILKILKKS